ncbi:family 16 glycoside hydrolase [Flavobacterium sp. HJSW_4]|uniref:family 16 glycoside hydrolase n=1 Tax=Flavobacterium sp. HJSW_4 TaxID=3344660 RepID=UPI0035F2C07A
MKTTVLSILFLLFFSTLTVGQEIKLSKEKLIKALVSFEDQNSNEQNVIKVIMNPDVKVFDEPTFVKLKDFNFKNGTIEVEVLSKFLPDAPDWARGFIGVAFRINEQNSKFESIYVRPDNGRSDDQIRRNHSVQYYGYPDFKFDRLRKESPEKYESYADMEMNSWIKMRIVVKGAQAKLYLNHNDQPSIVVLDMKHGSEESGSIGFWVGPGTEGYFKNLKVMKE